MKNLKNYIKDSGTLVILCIVIFSIDVLAMRMPAAQRAASSAERGLQRRNQYFLYGQDDPYNGIWVDKDFIKANCAALKNMIADFGGAEAVNIPIFGYSIEVIKLGFDVLANKIMVPDLSFTELINVANLFNFLEVPADKMKTVLDRILADFNNISDQELKNLNADVQKSLFTDPAINYLKDCIIKKYAQERKQVLKRHDYMIYSVAVSADGKRMVSGSVRGANNLILWDVSNPNNVTKQVLVGHPGDIYAVAISFDGTKIVSGGNGLVLWDISNLNNITHQAFGVQQHRVECVAFNFDDKRIVAGGRDIPNNLIVWDISNPQNITPQVFVGHLEDVLSVAVSPDGKSMVSSSAGSKNNLILWNMSNPNNITHQVLVGHQSSVHSVALSPDGKHIVSGCFGVQSNLIVWDITDPNNITHQVLVGPQNSVMSVAWSPDGKHIVSGNFGVQSNLIVWDITDPHNIIRLLVQQNLETVRSIALSLDGKRMVLGGNSRDDQNLILLTLLTDEEDSLLQQVTGYNADQIRLMYRLCLQTLKDEKITQSSEEQIVFKTLPQDMQKLLTDVLLNKGWFSRLW